MVLRLQQLCFLIAILSGSSAAQSSLLWDYLPPGRFSASFRYLEHLDTSRVWKDDALGIAHAGRTAALSPGSHPGSANAYDSVPLRMIGQMCLSKWVGRLTQWQPERVHVDC